MAIVFISPKQRQKMFFLAITAILSVILIIISVVIFISGPEEVPAKLVFNKPKISIDLSVFDSEKFQKLLPFSEMPIQFFYRATTKENKEVEGYISAVSKEEAQKTLESTGLKVLKIEEADIGRDNPFTPYYQQTIEEEF